jgi:hypothetical protein
MSRTEKHTWSIYALQASPAFDYFLRSGFGVVAVYVGDASLARK